MTARVAAKFDSCGFPVDALLHDRRAGPDRRAGDLTPAGGIFSPVPAFDRRERNDRRRRVDPTTFDKQYTRDELDFMAAIQKFKEQTGNPYPSHRDVLKVAVCLGYRKAV
jgi:hypothetical protein